MFCCSGSVASLRVQFAHQFSAVAIITDASALGVLETSCMQSDRPIKPAQLMADCYRWFLASKAISNERDKDEALHRPDHPPRSSAVSGHAVGRLSAKCAVETVLFSLFATTDHGRLRTSDVSARQQVLPFSQSFG